MVTSIGAITRRRGVTVGIAVAVALALTFTLGLLGPGTGKASSHREAPLVSADPQIDNTDVYAFVSPDDPDTVTFVSSWIPFEEPAGGPNFYNFADNTSYDIKVDNNGNAKPDITFRWNFSTTYKSATTSFLYNNGPVESLSDENLLVVQNYTLKKKTGSGKFQTLTSGQVVPNNVGAASTPNYASLFNAGIKTFSGGKTWVGQSDDPFFLDLRVFDLIYGGNLSEVGDDTLAGFNVHTMALQVPIASVTAGDPTIGVWSTASRKSTRIQSASGEIQTEGKAVQVSRLGMPLVNEVVVPVGLKDYWNGSKPDKDAQYLAAVDNPEVPHVVEAVYGVPAPDSDPNAAGIQRSDLISVFLTGLEGLNQPANVTPSEMLRLNTSIPPCEAGSCEDYSALGVIDGDLAGYPNGRRLADDIIDVSLRVVEGVLLEGHNPIADALADGVNVNDVEFLSTFPYVAMPHSGSDADPHTP